MCILLNEELILFISFLIETILLNICLMYVNFLTFLEGKFRQTVIKRIAVHRPQCIGNFLCAPVNETLAPYTPFSKGIMLFNVYMMYINFIVFLEGQLCQNIVKRNSVHDRNALTIFCVLLCKSCLLYVHQKTMKIILYNTWTLVSHFKLIGWFWRPL